MSTGNLLAILITLTFAISSTLVGGIAVYIMISTNKNSNWKRWTLFRKVSVIGIAASSCMLISLMLSALSSPLLATQLIGLFAQSPTPTSTTIQATVTPIPLSPIPPPIETATSVFVVPSFTSSPQSP